MIKSAEKDNFLSHVWILNFREEHRGWDWRPWRAGSGPRAVLWNLW